MIERIGRRFYAALDAGDEAAVRALVSPALRVRVGSEPETGFAAWWRGLGAFRAGFPDGAHTFEEWIVAGEYLITRGSYAGTHTGEFGGVAPTGIAARTGVLHVDRVVHGVLTEHCGQLDLHGLLAQLTRAGSARR